jgi:flagellar protein FlaG
MINDVVKSGLPPQAPVRESAPVFSAAPASTTTGTATEPDAAKAAVASPAPERLEAAVSKLNDYVQSIRRTLSFSIEESTGRTVISVYDAETEELIRQIPPEETLKLAELIDERSASLFIKERA